MSSTALVGLYVKRASFRSGKLGQQEYILPIDICPKPGLARAVAEPLTGCEEPIARGCHALAAPTVQPRAQAGVVPHVTHQFLEIVGEGSPRIRTAARCIRFGCQVVYNLKQNRFEEGLTVGIAAIDRADPNACAPGDLMVAHVKTQRCHCRSCTLQHTRSVTLRICTKTNNGRLRSYLWHFHNLDLAMVTATDNRPPHDELGRLGSAEAT